MLTRNKDTSRLHDVLSEADVQIGGDRPQDIQVHVEPNKLYRRVIAQGKLGLGESYMDEWWDANELDVFIETVIRANLQQRIEWSRYDIWAIIIAVITNQQNRRRSKRVARMHYDLSDVLPDGILDPYNQYTCAYFDGTDQLDVAQEKKLDLICRKLKLQKDDRVLDIGCGWGGFAKYASEHYGCNVTGISISEEQIRYAQRFCKDLPVDIRMCDYRDLDGEYDKVLTCGMIEHVGYKNYRRLFKVIHKHMADDGLYLLHTIGSNESVKTNDPFLEKYIFPDGMVPSVEQIDRARAGLFSLQDVQNLAAHYSPTLLAWHRNFQSNWGDISKHYDERFRRMFEFYLLYCAGGFRAGNLQHWQMVFAKQGQVIDYRGDR